MSINMVINLSLDELLERACLTIPVLNRYVCSCDKALVFNLLDKGYNLEY